MAATLTRTLSAVGNGVATEKGLRAPSFSSYLNGAEKSFKLNLQENQCKQANDDEDDGEIGVFSADKYFKESLDEEKLKPVRMVPRVENPIQLRAMSVRSGSSGNSQSALLQRGVSHRQSVNGVSKLRGRGGGGYLGSFRCRCVCSDKNSVAVEEYESCGESDLTLSQRAAKETAKKVVISPVMVGSLRVNDQGLIKRETYLISKDTPAEEQPRKSLEVVFGRLPAALERTIHKPSQPFVFETQKKLRLNWEDEFPKPVQTRIPTTGHAVDAESDSDASSDLFEIDDFTGKVNPFLSRNMSGSVTPTAAGYAPSEASIAWSVVTASAADFPITSAANEDLKSGKSSATNSNPAGSSTMMNKKVASFGDTPRRVTSSFFTCNSQASVKVVDHAHKTHEKNI